MPRLKFLAEFLGKINFFGYIIFYMRVCINCNIEKELLGFRGNRKKCESCYNKLRYQEIKERRKNDPKYDIDYKKYDVLRKRKKEKETPLENFKQRMRSNLRGAFKRRGYKKNTKSHKLLGEEWTVVKDYFELLFQEGMTWDNMGKWHIDHIIPLSGTETEEDVIRLCHYTNLQPLWAEDNWEKSDKIL
jgi:hypothetical protein